MIVEPSTDAGLLAQVLRPYRKQCQYLRLVHIDKGNSEVAARGSFAIPESCYIDDTGHFNAVEFNLCYNQLGYYLIAKCVEDQLLPAFADWSLADFWERQLSDILIYRLSSRFKRFINPRSFTGDVVFRQPVVRERPGRPPVMFMETTCAWWDDNGGSADGEVTLALTRLPQRLARHPGDQNV
jgi:hypothetical protein